MAPSNNSAIISLGLNNNALAAGIRSSMGMLQSFAQNVAGKLSQVAFSPRMFKTQQWLSHTAGRVSGVMAVRGIDALVDQGKAVFDFENKLVRFGIAAKSTPMQLMAIRNAARASAAQIGVDASVVLDSARAYVDLAGAQNASIDKMRVLARVGQASEAEGKDLAGMMYQLTRSMKVADGQMEDTMGGLINQAKEGAIEAKQMAAEFSGMMPIFARFGITGREGAIQLGAMYQVTRDGFDSAAQAATGMIRLMAGFQRHASRFREWGIQVFKPGSKKDLRSLSDIMEQVKKSPLSKNVEALIKAFGRSEAWRTFELLEEAPKRLKDLEDAGRANGVIAKDLATYAESAGGKMAISFERMKNAIAEAFTPERIMKFVSAIEGLSSKIEPLVEGVGRLGDGLGAIYGAGKAIHGFVKPGDSIIRSTSEDEAKRVSMENGMGLIETRQAMQEDWSRSLQLKRRIGDALKFDRTNEATDKLAVQAAEQPYRPGITDLHAAAQSYLNVVGVTPERYQELAAQLRKEKIEADIKSGHGRSAKDMSMPTMADLKNLIDTGLAPAVSRAIVQAQNHPSNKTVLTIDGNPIASSSRNATDRRRK